MHNKIEDYKIEDYKIEDYKIEDYKIEDYKIEDYKIEDYKIEDYKIAIPSYQRAQTLHDRTLHLLNKYNISPSRIHIFLANDKEKEEYQKLIPETAYHKIIIGEPGIKNIRNFMANYFDEDEPLFYIDDDIYNVMECVNHNMDMYHKRDNVLVPLDNLHQFIINGFRMALENKCHNWGIYPVYNAYFMKPTKKDDNKFYTTTALRYIQGGFTGVINKKRCERRTMDDKEDYERTIKYYLYDGGVFRFNNITAYTKCYKEKGGMQVKRTKERILQSAKMLVELYPNLCRLNLKKKSGYAEITFSRKCPIIF